MEASPAVEVKGAKSDPGVEGGDHEGESPSPDPLPLSQVFELLSNTRRRMVLRILRDGDGSSTLSDVAEIIAARENDKEVSQLTSGERKRTYVGLYQCHLPKMDDSDVIEFDKNRGDIRLGPNAPLVFGYLDDEEPRPWARYYLALAGVWSGILVLGQVADVSVLASPAATALQLVTFSLCGIAHFRETRTQNGESRVPLVEAGDRHE